MIAPMAAPRPPPNTPPMMAPVAPPTIAPPTGSCAAASCIGIGKWQQDCRIRSEDGVAHHTKKENQNERVRMPAFARERDSPIAPRKRLINITKKYQYPGEE